MRWTRRQFLEALTAGPLLAGCASRAATVAPPVAARSSDIPSAASTQTVPSQPLHFSEAGRCSYGEWRADVRLSSSQWTPGDVLALDLSLTLSPSIWSEIHSGDRGIDALAILITSQRCFDLHGWLRLPEDEQFARVILAPRRSRLALTPGRPSSKGGLRAGDALARGGGAQGRPGQP